MTTPTVRETPITREGNRIMPDTTYTSELNGRAAVTRYGERGVILGRALDPTRYRTELAMRDSVLHTL
jgi:hypothetical protein